ncbi:uncharacterized protein BO66DRAFT_390506 [Aspergillus aculeatinus CBS 121060]|uniref:DUF7907 domain-containing protein n=2 Tax=Aspergillus TaxID=5052 RepID=A0A8G1RDX5_9EURO|nr:hypothetical protein BO66DRAFT_390506 [Aspergillus aculeatinus CBS 121060]XP_040795511.1 uncharacterized protein BO72DRAFT_391838 [Aspergillus fijiensis CBS 313.89]RAH72026.1 hypothetical protein BO66DRAFT_390506 [Aspergillus aculeatinus CBS 121060]RAK71499.1 hypothetical protein BO72DRAFT_391838 [Aspergillus fijiensis CBS 313.89]
MKFLASLALLVSAVAASPIQARDTAKSFYLKTSGAANDAHNNLYVYAYHTGAGFNDAVLTSDTSRARAVTLNGTNAQFDLGTTFPWGFKMGANTNYASWEPVQINVGYGDEGFSVNGTSLQWSEQNGFGGWLVCDWYHNAPQLFWLYKYLPATIPSSCDKVDLTVEYTS